MENRWKKENISIAIIGKSRFWFGIIVGLFTAIVLAFSFNYFREVFRLLSIIYTDIVPLPERKFWLYTFFFSCLSCFLGLNMTLYIWMDTHYQKRLKHRLLKKTSKMYHLLFFWFFLFIITRFSSVISIFYFGVGGTLHFEELIDNYIYFFFLIPIFIFLKSWSVIQLIVKCRKWMILSFLISIITAIFLTFITKVDQSTFNNLHKKRFEKEHHYVDGEVVKICQNYGLKLNSETIKTLKERNTYASQFQAFKVQEAFAADSRISLDTILLQRMIIHNFKENWSYSNKNELFNYDSWRYATPFQIKNQLKYFTEEEPEAIELFKLLREIEDVAYFKYTVENEEDLNDTDYRKYLFSESQDNTLGFDVHYIIFTDQDTKAKFPSLLNILYFNPEK